MTPDIESRARAAASKCEIILDLARALNVDFQVACHFNEKLKLGLPVRRKVEGPKTEGRAVPKPAKKGAGK